MIVDRRKLYYSLAGAVARDDWLAFQARYLAGLAFQRALRLRASRCASLELFTAQPTKRASNVLTLRRTAT